MPKHYDVALPGNLVRGMLEYIGEDPDREGLRETPGRVLRAWDEWFSGYRKNPADVFKTFSDGAENYNEMVVLTRIPVQSHCEHHLAPFIGEATVGYIPSGRIVGLSKLTRLVDIFAKRLQVQERLSAQIADALVEGLAPKGAGVIISCEHQCMATRGVHKPGVITTTSAMRGLFLDDSKVRAEFVALHKDYK